MRSQYVTSEITNLDAAIEMVLDHLEGSVWMPGFTQKTPPERKANSIRFVFTKVVEEDGPLTGPDPVYVSDKQFASMSYNDFYLCATDTFHLNYTVTWCWEGDGKVSLVPVPGFRLVLDLCLCA